MQNRAYFYPCTHYSVAKRGKYKTKMCVCFRVAFFFLFSNPASGISINSSCPSHVCFCAVCSRVAPWTGPAHCVNLLCCRCSGCLQHHRYSHPEIVSHIHAYIHTHWLNDTAHQMAWFLLFFYFYFFLSHYLEPIFTELYVFDGYSLDNSRMVFLMLLKRSLCVNPFYQQPFPHEKLKFSCLLRFLDPPAWLSSPQDVMSVGEEALSVCCTASVKHVFLPYSAELQLFSALDTCSSVNAFTPAGATSRRACRWC